MAVRCSCAPDEGCRAIDERTKEYSLHLVGPELNTYVTKMYRTTNIKSRMM
jgi:hypothetical protein